MLQRTATPPIACAAEQRQRPTAPDLITRHLRAAAARLTRADRTALAYWAAAHAALLILAYTAAWVLAPDKAHLPLAGGFQQWDANLYQSIARYGYFGGPGGTLAHPNQAAFFPGYALALAAVHLAVRNWTAAELLLSLVAGGCAVVSLARLAGSSRAALYLLTAPAAVFLTVGYSESLYLAFAIPAWSTARRRAWAAAGTFAFFAALTRPDALFLIPALAVMALQSGPGRLRAAAPLALGVLPPAVYTLYLWSQTHRWSAWFDANQAGWGLHYVGPWQSLKASYWGAFRHPYSAEFGLLEQLEIACLAVMLAAAVAFAARRRWPEAVYCALGVCALGTSTWYQSVPRTLLILFPVWVALARSARRHPWIGGAYLAVSGPLAVVLALLYLGGRWAG